jgi:protoporphyrinogen oxidase
MIGHEVNKAIAIGGGIAGMCSAKVLADHYDEVILLERDEYPDGIAYRLRLTR